MEESLAYFQLAFAVSFKEAIVFVYEKTRERGGSVLTHDGSMEKSV